MQNILISQTWIHFNLGWTKIKETVFPQPLKFPRNAVLGPNQRWEGSLARWQGVVRVSSVQWLMPFLSQAGIQSPSIQWSAFLASHSHPPGCLRGLNKVATLPIDADSYWIPGTRCVKLISIYLKSLCSCYKSVYHLETPQAGYWQSRIFGRCGKKWLSTYLGGNIKRRGLVCRRLLYWLACSLWPPKMATSCALEPPCTVVMEGFYSGPADIFHAWPTHAVVKTRRLEEDGVHETLVFCLQQIGQSCIVATIGAVTVWQKLRPVLCWPLCFKKSQTRKMLKSGPGPVKWSPLCSQLLYTLTNLKGAGNP